MQPKARTRAGTYATFERRYQPVAQADGTILIDHGDLPKDIDPKLVWTVVEAEGKLYLTPGFATVNYFARVVCEAPWPDSELTNPGYVY